MNWNSLLRRCFFSLVFMAGVWSSANATHLRAGEIIVERLSCNSLTFRITITVFTNTINTNVLFGGEDDWLDFGDGQRMLVPETPNTIREDLGPGIATASFSVTHTYSGFQAYTISYSEPNRNEGVVNMDGSVNTRFYIESRIIVDPFLGCNNTPQLLVPPIDRACTGVAWFHNPGAFDPDGDSLSYELVIPFREKNTTVINYRDPADPQFYTNFGQGDETGTKQPTFKIDPRDGTLTWDAPGMSGEYNIAFVIKEWRRVGGQWYNTGFVRRDMQIVVDDCDNERPDLIVPDDICVEAGTTIDVTIFGIDPDNDPVKIEAFSQIFELAPAQSPATYTPNDGEFVPSVPPAELHFIWNTTCDHVKEQPYQVVFKITDDSPTGSNLVTYKTWFIRVVGPKPEWVSAQVNLATRVADLEWESYLCQNAETIQVWRRVDSFPFSPDECQTGMPEFLGYELIANLPVTGANNVPTTTYRDNNNGRGLATGAEYCYRLVAVFPAPKGGESYVSEEICVPPILADEPIITNVSVQRTSTTDGQIYVRWMKPFEIDRTQFPGPFEYELFRSDGFAGTGNSVKVHTGRLEEDDTVYVDSGPNPTNLNTRDNIYNYRVVLYSNTSQDLNTWAPIDTSFVASTVRLDAESQVGQITLNWSAFVPWSNLILTEPNEHNLFRGPAGSDESGLSLFQEIDPTTAGFRYVDEGLEDTEEYCYRVMTRGAYGNPAIIEPLENYSQIVCAQPNDTIPPCKPNVFNVDLVDCETFLADQACDFANFSNTLRWTRPEDNCGDDIMGYKIYRASEKEGEFVWLESAGVNGIVRDTFYIDNGINNAGLSTMAYCYKVSSVDRSNNESEPSDAACNDNCPYYELPNVFTPNDLNDCNSTFGAWRHREYYMNGIDENGVPNWKCGEVDKKCARFVKGVVLTVYNRWGKQVYSYRSGGERTIYIDWDGHADDGSELASGIYYYSAEVTFDVVDPEKRNQIIKGWVHLIR